jgi:hypothetical protein
MNPSKFSSFGNFATQYRQCEQTLRKHSVFPPQSIAEQHHETNNQSNVRLQFTTHFAVSENDQG